MIRAFFAAGASPLLAATLVAQSAVISGKVTDEDRRPVQGARVQLTPGTFRVTTSASGDYRIDRVAPGSYVLRVSAVGFLNATRDVALGSADQTVNVSLQQSRVTLEEISVVGTLPPGGVQRGIDVAAGLPVAAVKTEVLEVSRMSANLAEKTGRQVFARIPGVFVYDMDGSGNQVNISTRGLDPHRSWELNVRQDGVLLNSDVYGYPASHYSPPMEAMRQVEVVRGTAALQYGSQFGGLVNYVTKEPVADRTLSLESNNSAGTFGLRSTYNAIGVRTGALTLYAYASFRHSDGYRANATSDYNAQLFSARWAVSPTLTVKGQVGRSAYTYRIPGPLTDPMFEADPRTSTRTRNYFNPDIVVPSLAVEWHPSRGTRLSLQQSAVLGERNSVQFLGFATVPDEPNGLTGEFAPRQVDIDTFNSWTTELRLSQDYRIGSAPASLSSGVVFSRNRLRRRQQGVGTRASDFDLSVTAAGFGRDIFYRTTNVAIFGENLMRLTPRWSLIPGARIELGRTRMTGRLAYYDPADTPRNVDHHFPLFGIRTTYATEGGTELYSGWSQAYRPMILKDVLPESAIERTDPDLKDAKGWTVEAGVRGNVGILSFDASAFALRYDNRFGTVLRTDGATQYLFKTNVGSTMTKGLELSLDAKLLTTDKVSVRAFTATSYHHARYREGTVAVDGQNQSIVGNEVEAAPKWISRNGLTVAGARLSGTALLSHVAKSFADPLNTLIPSANGARGLVPAYTVLDLNASAEVTRSIRIRGGVTNLFDKRYFTKRPSFYPGPGIWPSDGRGAYVSLDLSGTP